jgi:predicted MPP superfamily phosphohydrolase
MSDGPAISKLRGVSQCPNTSCEAGSLSSEAERTVPWLLMVHDPVRVQPVISKAGPDFVHFGHYHGPGGFSRRSGNTLFLSAGQQLEAAIPNHIVLDSETGIAVWKCG